MKCFFIIVSNSVNRKMRRSILNNQVIANKSITLVDRIARNVHEHILKWPWYEHFILPVIGVLCEVLVVALEAEIRKLKV